MGVIDKAIGIAYGAIRQDSQSTAPKQSIGGVGTFLCDAQGRARVPYMLYEFAINTGFNVSQGYYVPLIKAMEPFEKYHLKSKSQSAKNMPEGWQVEKGGIAFFDDNGSFVGNIGKSTADRYGVKPNRVYYGFMIPPCSDALSGMPLQDEWTFRVMP